MPLQSQHNLHPGRDLTTHSICATTYSERSHRNVKHTCLIIHIRNTNVYVFMYIKYTHVTNANVFISGFNVLYGPMNV